MGGQLYGDWDRLGMTFNRLSLGGLTEHIRKEYQAKADEVVKIIQNHIRKQDLGWTPLALSTIERKGHDNAYIETGQLYNSFKTELREESMGFSVWIGVNPEAYGDTGYTLVDILAFNEFGGMLEGKAHPPSRPLLRPTYMEVEKDFVSRILKSVKEYFGIG